MGPVRRWLSPGRGRVRVAGPAVAVRVGPVGSPGLAFVEVLRLGLRGGRGGRAVVSARVAVVLLWRVGDAIFADAFSPSTRLSGPELGVLSQLADGKTDRQIAEALSMTSSEVRDHAADIIVKLQLEGGVRHNPAPRPG